MNIFKKNNHQPYIQILNKPSLSKKKKNEIINIVKESLFNKLSISKIEKRILSELGITSHVYVYDYPNKKKYYVVI